MGIRYQGNDAMLETAVCPLFIEVCTSTKKVLEDSSFVWDSANPNPRRSEDVAAGAALELPESQEAEPEDETQEDVMRHYRIKRKPEPSMGPARPEFLSDGRAILQARKGDGFIEMMQQTSRIFRRYLKGDDLLVASKWVEKVTGKPVRDGIWEDEHEDAFVRGQERFFWEGNFPAGVPPELSNMKAWYREAYPVLGGSPIDIELDDEMRGLFRRKILGG